MNNLDEKRIPLWMVRTNFQLIDNWGPLSSVGMENFLVPGVIDATQGPAFHYALGKMLAPLRDEGILVIGCGNVVQEWIIGGESFLAYYEGPSGQPGGSSQSLKDFGQKLAEIRYVLAMNVKLPSLKPLFPGAQIQNHGMERPVGQTRTRSVGRVHYCPWQTRITVKGHV